LKAGHRRKSFCEQMLCKGVHFYWCYPYKPCAMLCSLCDLHQPI
jgi:hypothetical protein